MFDTDTYTGNQAIEKLICKTKFFALWLFLGLQRMHTLWLVALKTSIFLEPRTGWVMNIFNVCHFFIVRLATISLAEIRDPLGILVDDDQVLVRMGLFLPL